MLALEWPGWILSSFQNTATSGPGYPAVHKGRTSGQTPQVTSSPRTLACDHSYKQTRLPFSLSADTCFSSCVVNRLPFLTGCCVSSLRLETDRPRQESELATQLSTQ